MDCPNCGHKIIITNTPTIECPICAAVINVEGIFIDVFGPINFTEAAGETIPEIGEGSLVKFNNKQHPWYEQICLVVDTKHLFIRVEALGKRLWVPAEWVEPIND